MKKAMIVDMPDGSKWAVETEFIARNHAFAFRSCFDGDPQRAYTEDTLPLFEDEKEIADWAQNNMNWSDISNVATLIAPPPQPDYQEGWVNGTRTFI